MNQIARTETTSVTVYLEPDTHAVSKTITVTHGSSACAAFAFSLRTGVGHFGLICKNNWNVDGVIYPVVVMHAMPTGERQKCGVRIEFCQNVDEATKKLLKISGGGEVLLSKFQSNSSSLNQIVPLFGEVLEKQFVWQPFKEGYTPQTFLESDDCNCKRFMGKVEQHLSFRVEEEFSNKCLDIVKKYVKISNDPDLKDYVGQIRAGNVAAACNIL